MFKPTVFAAAFATVAALAGVPHAQAEPEIAVSIKPIHSLVASVTRGVTEPYLLIPGSASPHAYSLKPSDAQALESADVVFWVGENMETFMTKPLEALADDAKVVALAAAPGVTLLEVREGGDWDAHDHDHGGEEKHGHDHGHGDKHAHDHEHDHGHEHGHEHGAKHAHEGHAHEGGTHGDMDMHLWLDPANAKAMVQHMVGVLSEADPANAATYEKNGAETITRLDRLRAELRDMLAAVKDKPFFVFHDAYQYFEAAFDLRGVGSITVAPEVQPGAQRVREISEKIRKAGAKCVFAEPQFEPKLIGVVTEGTDARSGVLDPLGADIESGVDLYFKLMRQNAQSLAGCLSAEG